MVNHVCGWLSGNRTAKSHLRPLVTLVGAPNVGWGKAGEMEMVSTGNAFKEIFREGVFFCLFGFFKE